MRPRPLVRFRHLDALRSVRVSLVLAGLVAGGWALFAPRSFYAGFPGGGRHWVSIDGPYNEHFVRDFGALNLALAAVTAIAAVRLERTVAQAASIAWLVFSVPHLIYHLGHLRHLDAVDRIGNLATLGAVVTLGIAGLALSRTEPPTVVGWAVFDRRAG